AFKIVWQLLENGVAVQSGEIAPLNISAGEKATFKVPCDRGEMAKEKEYFLRIAFQTRTDADWAKAGHEVTFSEFKLAGNYTMPLKTSAAPPKIVSKKWETTVITDNGLSCTFDKKRGTLISLSIKGHQLMAKSERRGDRSFDHDQALIDNYTRHWKLHLRKFDELKLGKLEKVGDSRLTVKTKKNKVVVQISSSFRSPKNAGFDEVQTWKIDGAGQIEVIESVTPAGKLGDDVWVPRIGLYFQLSKDLQQVAYYGKGPHGNYNDRSYGAWTAVHEANVMDHYVPYGKPQDHGNRESVRWLKLSDANGSGLKIIAPEPLAMCVLPYTQEELASARHTVDLPAPSITELRIAARVSGVGNGSCGPITREEYQALSAPVEYRFILIPFISN
ncbi:MAG: beta-galactosidase domain 4-containing protein, partial [Planctomycetota bacterium]